MPQTLIDAIKQAQKEQNWQKVIELCDELHQQLPEKWESLWWAGHTHKNLRQYIQAEEWFTKLKTAFPNRHLGLEGWVNVAEHQQNWAEMSQRVDAFEAQYPDLWHVPFWRGMIAKNTQCFDEAERHYALLAQKRPEWHVGWEEPVKMAFQRGDYRRAIELNPTFQAAFPHLWQSYWWVGQSYKNLGLYDEAMAQFAQLKEKSPQNHHGWEGEINIAQHQQNWQSVIELATVFQAAFPQMWQGFWFVGQAYKNLGQYDLALQQFALLKEKFPKNHQGWEGEVHVYQHQQNWQRVIELATAFQATFPHLWYGHWWVGQSHKNLGQYDLALPQFALLKEKFPKNHQGWEGEINIAQHQQNWQRVIELATAFQAAFPQMWQGFWWVGQAHKNLYEYEQAKAVFQTLITRFPHLHQGYEGLVNILEHQHDWQTILPHAFAFRQRFPHLWHSYYWEGLVYRHLGRYDDAIEVFHNMLLQFPKNLQSINALIATANDQVNWEMAYQYSEMGIKLFPHHLPFYLSKGQALVHQKRFDEAENYFLALEQQFPDDPIPLYGLTRGYYPLRKRNQVIKTFEKSFQQFPENQGVIRDLIDAYINQNEPQLALDLYENHLMNHQQPNHQILLAKIQQIIHGNVRYLDEMQRLHQQYPHDANIANHYAVALMEYTLPRQQGCSPELAFKIWEGWFHKMPKNETFKQRFIQVCIKMGLHSYAQNLIKTLPENKRNIQNMLLQAWQAHQQGNIEQERQHWNEILRKGFYAEMLLEKGNDLTSVSQREIHITEHDFVLFTVEYNELLRLPDFLDYYRKLGVSCFIVVDNGSMDGSLEFLLQQNDCHVFSTTTSYSEAGSGIAWVNYLMHKYALPNQWCIHADVDELLIYPHCETHRLKQLTAYLDSQNVEVMSSFMLDMFPKNLDEQLAFQSGDSMMIKSPYFYNAYHFYHQIPCPYIYPVGGIFHHFHIPPFALVKTGLFKLRKDFYFLCATHHTTPMKMADISSTYLHFKMLGNFKAKASAESQRKQHAAGGSMYRKYAQMYEQYIDEKMDLSALDKSVRYENSQQLVDLGLINTSLAWEVFVAQTKSHHP